MSLPLRLDSRSRSTCHPMSTSPNLPRAVRTTGPLASHRSNAAAHTALLQRPPPPQCGAESHRRPRRRGASSCRDPSRLVRSERHQRSRCAGLVASLQRKDDVQRSPDRQRYNRAHRQRCSAIREPESPADESSHAPRSHQRGRQPSIRRRGTEVRLDEADIAAVCPDAARIVAVSVAASSLPGYCNQIRAACGVQAARLASWRSGRLVNQHVHLTVAPKTFELKTRTFGMEARLSHGTSP